MTSETDDYRSCSAFRAKALCVSCGLSNIGASRMRQTCEARPPRFELGAPSIRRRGGILSTGALYLLEPINRFFRGLRLGRMSSPALLGQLSQWSKSSALSHLSDAGGQLLLGLRFWLKSVASNEGGGHAINGISPRFWGEYGRCSA